MPWKRSNRIATTSRNGANSKRRSGRYDAVGSAIPTTPCRRHAPPSRTVSRPSPGSGDRYEALLQRPPTTPRPPSTSGTSRRRGDSAAATRTSGWRSKPIVSCAAHLIRACFRLARGGRTIAVASLALALEYDPVGRCADRLRRALRRPLTRRVRSAKSSVRRTSCRPRAGWNSCVATFSRRGAITSGPGLRGSAGIRSAPETPSCASDSEHPSDSISRSRFTPLSNRERGPSGGFDDEAEGCHGGSQDIEPERDGEQDRADEHDNDRRRFGGWTAFVASRTIAGSTIVSAPGAQEEVSSSG